MAEATEVQQPEALARLRFETEEAFEAWCDEDIRAEYIDGEVIMHAPASARHERMARFLGFLLQAFVEKNAVGEVFTATNLQVRPRPGLRRVPDLVFISKDRLHLLRQTYFDGPPDLVVEIVSEDSFLRDWREKYYEYEQAGVQEYWVVDPQLKRIDLYPLLEGQKQYAMVRPEEDVLRSQVLSGFWLKPEWLWQDPLPNVLLVAQEMGILSR